MALAKGILVEMPGQNLKTSLITSRLFSDLFRLMCQIFSKSLGYSCWRSIGLLHEFWIHFNTVKIDYSN